MKLVPYRTTVWLSQLRPTGLALLGLFLLQRPAHPCSFPGVEPHRLDPAAQQVDRTSPTLGPTPAVQVQRGPSPQQAGCGVQSTSCDGLGSISITPAVADDRAPASEIGFRLRLTAGSLPEGLALPSGDIRATSGAIYFHWTDGTERDHEPFAFNVELIAIDTAGNLSAPVQVMVGDAGAGGCSMGHSSATSGANPGLLGWLTLAGLAMLGVRRRRSPRRTS
jgi:MYXO-CTERM domain-containing protein